MKPQLRDSNNRQHNKHYFNMAVTTEIEDPEVQAKIRALYALGLGPQRISKEIKSTRHQVNKYLVTAGLLKLTPDNRLKIHRLKNITSDQFSTNENHYGKEGANLKYTWEGLNATERALVNDHKHKELKKLN